MERRRPSCLLQQRTAASNAGSERKYRPQTKDAPRRRPSSGSAFLRRRQRPGGKGIAENRLSTPVAPERTTAAGDQVEGKCSVGGFPSIAILVDVGQVARGEREVNERATSCRLALLQHFLGTHTLQGGHPWYLASVAARANRFHDFKQGVLRLAD